MANLIRTIELPLSRDYVRQWGVAEAVRELIQNAIDSSSPFEYAFVGDGLMIASRFDTLDLNTLILGKTSKADADDQIGSFGEGYKIAMLVLVREGIDVVIRNGDADWVPSFRHSDNYGDEVLCIDIFEPLQHNQGLEFRLKGLTHTQSSAIHDSCLLMQPMMENVIETKRGNILADRPGKLYVGGLYVCDTELDYGYDMKPEFLKLERDRKTVDNWDLLNQTKEMWFSTGDWDDIANRMAAKMPDLAYAEYGCPELVKEACFRHFTKEHPGHLAVNSQKDLDAAVAKGMTKTVHTGGGSYHYGVTSSKSYLDSTKHIVIHSSPQQFLEEWLEKRQRGLSHPMRIQFRDLIAEAAKWRLK